MCGFSLPVFVLLQLTQSGNGVDGETDQMLASQVSLQCSVWEGSTWTELLGGEGRAVTLR